MGTVWILNLDAESELERPREYSPSRERLALNQVHAEGAGAGLLREGDVIWDEREAPREWRGWGVRAWCPTPRVLERARSAGLKFLGAAPSLDVLQRVNDRRFCAELGQCLPGAFFMSKGSYEQLGRVDPPAAAGSGWLLKRSFGVAGRGRRKIRQLDRMSEADENWVRASLKLGGLQVEPWCEEIEAEFVQEGVIDPSGEFRLGVPLLQRCTPAGAWVSCVPARDALEGDEREALRTEGERVAVALFHAGYSGPFALDAYRARAADGAALFVARSEINARYSMGWSMGPPY